MASIEKRRNAAGRITSFRVRWITGGVRGGTWDSESFKRETDAKQFRAEVEANGHHRPDTETGLQHSAVAGQGTTVRELVEAYIADRELRVRSDRTTADYRRDLERWIAPTFGDAFANDLDEMDVQEWVDGIRRAPKTVANIHGLLSAAYRWGARRRDGSHKRLVQLNPCSGTELPERHRTVRGLWSGEWAILYQAACEVDSDAADFLLFLVGTGWRWSEATALQTHQLDLDKGTVDMQGVRRRNGAGRIVHVDDAKSAASHGRKIRLSPALVTMLERRVTDKHLGDYVFTSRNGKPLHYSNFRDRIWARPADDKKKDPGGILARAQAAGLRANPTLHWLRHTHAALLLESGASLPGVQRRLGHESITATVDTYGRLVDDVSTDALASLDAALISRVRLRVVGDT